MKRLRLASDVKGHAPHRRVLIRVTHYHPALAEVGKFCATDRDSMLPLPHSGRIVRSFGSEASHVYRAAEESAAGRARLIQRMKGS